MYSSMKLYVHQIDKELVLSEETRLGSFVKILSNSKVFKCLNTNDLIIH